MRKNLKIRKPFKWLSVLLTLSIVHCQLSIAIAQYPVRSQTIIKSPYSAALSDYYTGTDAKLQLILTNTDIREPLIHARLQLSIVSNRVNLRSRAFIGPIIELDAGVPNFLSGMDLAIYFNPSNIEILSGLDYNALFKSPRLPDGTYTFRFDVVDAFTGRMLSDIKFYQPPINILSVDPPFLNLPRKGNNTRFADPLNIIFNWTPRAANKGITEYTFSLYEILDNGMPPENAPFMSQPIYQTTTSITTLLYGPTEPPLLPGKKYAWRIQAVAKQGIDSYSLYNNNGYTETFWFQLQDNCDPIRQISAVVRGGAVTLEWPDNPTMYKYIVQYRKKGDWNRWFNTETNNHKVIITDVAAGNTYEYQVGGICTVGAGATYSDIGAFTIPPRDSIRDKQCGILPNINLSNQNPLQSLSAGETVMVGDYPATILNVIADGGSSFSGTAAIKMNIFNIAEASVKATFNNVIFNTDKQLIKGFMVTTYDKDEKQIINLDEIFKNGGIVSGSSIGDSTVDYKLDFPLLFPQTAVVSGDSINGFTIKIKDNGNNIHIITGIENLPASFKDSNGDVYEIDKNGNIKKIEAVINKNTNNSLDANNGNFYKIYILNSSRSAIVDSIQNFNEIKYYSKKSSDSLLMWFFKADTISKSLHSTIAKWDIGGRIVTDSICYASLSTIGNSKIVVKVPSDSLYVTELNNGSVIKTDTIMKFEVNVVDQLFADWDYQSRSLYNGEFGFDIPEYDQFKTLYYSYNRGSISTLAPDLFLKQGQTVNLKLNFKNNSNIPRGYFAEFESTNGQVTITPNRLNRSDLQRTSMNISFTTSASDVFDNLIVRLKDTSGNVLTTIRIKSDSLRQRDIEFVKVITNNNDNTAINTNSWVSNINTLNNNMFIQNYVNWNATSSILDLRPTINDVKTICRATDSLRLINPALDRKHLFDSLKKTTTFIALGLNQSPDYTYYFENLDRDTLLTSKYIYTLIRDENEKRLGTSFSNDIRKKHYAFITNKFIGDLLGQAIDIPSQNDEPYFDPLTYLSYVLITKLGNMADLGHELGHILSLNHPFHLTKYRPIPKLNTILNGIGNVMDYESPTKSFWRWQSSNIIKFLKLLNP